MSFMSIDNDGATYLIVSSICAVCIDGSASLNGVIKGDILVYGSVAVYVVPFKKLPSW